MEGRLQAPYPQHQTAPQDAQNMIILILGMLLTGASWFIAWSPISLFSEYSFFPLWLGYILTVNGLSETLYSDSIMKRMRFNFPTLFAASIPFWWFFELINQIVQNMLIRLTPKHTIGSLAAETRCRYARRRLAQRGSALSGFTARVP